MLSCVSVRSWTSGPAKQKRIYSDPSIKWWNNIPCVQIYAAEVETCISIAEATHLSTPSSIWYLEDTHDTTTNAIWHDSPLLRCSGIQRDLIRHIMIQSNTVESQRIWCYAKYDSSYSSVIILHVNGWESGIRWDFYFEIPLEPWQESQRHFYFDWNHRERVSCSHTV